MSKWNQYKFLTTQTRHTIYKSYILPLIEYGDILYIKASNKNIEKIKKVWQNVLQNVSISSQYNSMTLGY